MAANTLQESTSDRADRRPNRRLRALLAEAGWSGQQLADAVNAAGLEAGVSARYDRTAVAHWLTGTRPRPPVPDLIAEALTRRLNRRITPADAGLATSSQRRSGSARTAPALDALPAPGVAGAATVYSLTALTVPTWAQAADHFAGQAPAAPPRPASVEAADAHGAQV
ncbi:hypothetical protein ACFQ08_37705, partial [Streptosporangium algeriense]